MSDLVDRLRAVDGCSTATRVDAADEIERLRDILRHIAEYPKKGSARRTRQGYPAEVIYDEFAYKRMVDSYRDAALAGLQSAQP